METGMRNVLALVAVGACVSLSALVTPAHAQALRTWVSGAGQDFNPCSRSAPCKTFAGALNKTTAGGQINCLDPGGFGTVTIGKSITIECEHGGGFGSVTSTVSGAIAVAAGPDDVVILRGLDLDGLAQVFALAQNGVVFSSGKALYVEDCFIHGFLNGGITVVTGSTSQVFVHNTYLSNNGIGMLLSPSGGAVMATLDEVSADANAAGLTFNGGSGSMSITVSNSSISENNWSASGTNNGLFGDLNTNLTMDNDIVYGNFGSGVEGNTTSAILLIGSSTIVANNTGVSSLHNGILQSFKNNEIAGNSTDGTPITAFPGPGGQPLQ
jgi:hypothetical protein